MSFRLPQTIQTQFGLGSGPSPLEREIAGEKAASLGRAGRLVQRRLQELRRFEPEDAGRLMALKLAADAVHSYFCSESYAASQAMSGQSKITRYPPKCSFGWGRCNLPFSSHCGRWMLGVSSFPGAVAGEI